MSVILFILKLIGIVLLALLGIVLLVLLLVLFLPMRYHVSGEIEEGVTIHARVTWFLHLISFSVDYQEGEIVSCLHIFGIRKKAKGKSALEEEAWEDEPKKSDDTAEIEKASGTEEVEKSAENGESFQTEVVSEVARTEQRSEETGKDYEASECKSLFRSIAERVRTFFDMVRTRIREFFEVVRKLESTIPQMLGKVSEIKRIIIDENNISVVKAIFTELGYLLKHFKFRKLDMDLRFSAGDPAATGQALGVLCMFPILYQYQLSIVPDFESEEFYVKGTFEIKGHIRVVHLVVSLVHLWKKKEVRIFVKNIR